MENTQKEKYFDVITRGVGYMGRLREVTPPGATPYWCVSVALLEGHKDKVKYIRMDAIVRMDADLALLRQHQEAINNDGGKVLACVQLGGIRARAFTYGPGSRVPKGKKAGDLGTALSTSLLSIESLKVGNEQVFRKERQPVEATGASPSDASADAGETEAPVAATATGDTGEGLPVRVELDPAAPDFGAKKAALKAQGYRWHSDGQAWVLPDAS